MKYMHKSTNYYNTKIVLDVFDFETTQLTNDSLLKLMFNFSLFSETAVMMVKPQCSDGPTRKLFKNSAGL